jgi:adenosylcobyric acid synthase
MLGTAIHDPYSIEGDAGSSAGLGWLEIQTTLEKQKQLKQVTAQLAFANALVTGYEIHMGVSQGPGMGRPALCIEGQPEGAISEDGQVVGTYVHGLFDHPQSCAAWLAWAGLIEPVAFDYEVLREQGLNRLADCLEVHLDWQKLNAHLF